MTRQSLISRRASTTLEFTFEGLSGTGTFSRFADGRVAEVFLLLGKPGDQLYSMAQDTAVSASLALQHGVPLQTLLAALSQELDGRMRGPLGQFLQLILQQDKPSDQL